MHEKSYPSSDEDQSLLVRRRSFERSQSAQRRLRPGDRQREKGGGRKKESEKDATLLSDSRENGTTRSSRKSVDHVISVRFISGDFGMEKCWDP
jgi:hypothetical protein